MSGPDREARVAALGAGRLGAPPAQVRVQVLTGYTWGRTWRVSSPTGRTVLVVEPGGPRSLAAAGPAGVAEPAAPPLVDVHRYLADAGVRVPALLEHAADEGLVVLEDPGERTIEAAVTEGGRSPLVRDELYAAAVGDLAFLRRRGEEHPDPGCVAFRRVLGPERLRQGLELFLGAALGGRTGLEPSAPELEVVRDGFDDLAGRLAGLPVALTHRRYRAGSLVVVGRELVVLDFQDALQGPLVYDLVSLLRDPLVPLPSGLVDHLLDRYLDGYGALGGRAPEREELDEAFDLMSLQQSLENAGHALVAEEAGAGAPAAEAPGDARVALGYAREALTRLPEYAPLWEVLSRYVPELRLEVEP